MESLCLNRAQLCCFRLHWPHLEIQGYGIGSSVPIPNFGVKVVSINWVSIALSRAANIFNRLHLLFEIRVSSSNVYA